MKNDMNIKLSGLIDQLKKLDSAREQVEQVTSSGNALTGNISKLLDKVNGLVSSIDDDFTGTIGSYTDELKETCKSTNQLIESELKEYKKNKETLQDNLNKLKSKIDIFQVDFANTATGEINKIGIDLKDQGEQQIAEIIYRLKDLNNKQEVTNNKNIEILSDRTSSIIAEYKESLEVIKNNHENEIKDIVTTSSKTLKPYITNIENMSVSITNSIKDINKLLENIKSTKIIDRVDSIENSQKEIALLYVGMASQLENIIGQNNNINQFVATLSKNTNSILNNYNLLRTEIEKILYNQNSLSNALDSLVSSQELLSSNIKSVLYNSTSLLSKSDLIIKTLEEKNEKLNEEVTKSNRIQITLLVIIIISSLLSFVI